MAERTHPWRPKPPQNVVDLLHRVGTTRCYLVQRMGPASFIVREEGSDVKRRVLIGSEPSCSCWPPGNGREPCIHILFVLVKVLRVPPDNPLVWQLSLSDRELEEVLACSALPTQSPVDGRQRQQPKTSSQYSEEGGVKRKILDEEDVCPICYEDIGATPLSWLVWCRYGCGNNVHGKCMGVWADHQTRSLGKTLTCPFCRTDWGEFKWKPPPRPRKVKQARTDVHYGCRCGACRLGPLTGSRFRCLVCSDFSLCAACFAAGSHPQHPFACRQLPGGPEVAATRSGMMPSVVQLRAPSDQHQHPSTSMDAASSQEEEEQDSETEGSTSSAARRRRSLESRSGQEAGGQQTQGRHSLGRSRSVGAGRHMPAATDPEQSIGADTVGRLRAAPTVAAANLASHPVDILWHDGLDEPLHDGSGDQDSSEMAPGWMHNDDSTMALDPGPSFSHFDNVLANPACVHAPQHRRVASGPSGMHTAAAWAPGIQRQQSGEHASTSEAALPSANDVMFGAVLGGLGRPAPALPPVGTCPPAGDSTASSSPHTSSLLQAGPSSSHFGNAFTAGQQGRRHSSAPRTVGRPVHGSAGRARGEGLQQPTTLDAAAGSAVLLCGVQLADPNSQRGATQLRADGGRPAATTAAATDSPAAAAIGATAAGGSRGGRCSSMPRQQGVPPSGGSRLPRGRPTAPAGSAPQLLLSVLSCQSGGSVQQNGPPEAEEWVGRTASCRSLGHGAPAGAMSGAMLSAASVSGKGRSVSAQRRQGKPTGANRAQDPDAGTESVTAQLAVEGLGRQSTDEPGNTTLGPAAEAHVVGSSTAGDVHAADCPSPPGASESGAVAGTGGDFGWDGGAEAPAILRVDSLGVDSQGSSFSLPEHVDYSALRLAIERAGSSEAAGVGGWLGRQRCRVAPEAAAGTVAALESCGSDSQGSSFTLPEHVDAAMLQVLLASSGAAPPPPNGIWLSRQRQRVAPEDGHRQPHDRPAAASPVTAAQMQEAAVESQGSSFSLPEHVEPSALLPAPAPVDTPANGSSWLSRQRLRVAPERSGRPPSPSPSSEASLPAARPTLGAATGSESQSSSLNLPEHTEAAGATVVHTMHGILPRARVRVLPSLPSCKPSAAEGPATRLPGRTARRHSRVDPLELGTLALLDITVRPLKQVGAGQAAPRRSPSAPASRVLLHGDAEAWREATRRAMAQGCGPAAMAAQAILDGDVCEQDWKTFSNPAYNRPYCADLPTP